MLWGDLNYDATVGSLTGRCGPTSDASIGWHLSKDWHLGRYHIWAGRIHANGRAEIIDLTPRRWPAEAADGGRPWTHKHAPTFLWTWADMVPAWTLYESDARATYSLRDGAHSAGFLPEGMPAARYALDLLAGNPSPKVMALEIRVDPTLPPGPYRASDDGALVPL